MLQVHEAPEAAPCASGGDSRRDTVSGSHRLGFRNVNDVSLNTVLWLHHREEGTSVLLSESGPL